MYIHLYSIGEVHVYTFIVCFQKLETDGRCFKQEMSYQMLWHFLNDKKVVKSVLCSKP